jgi:hypothetical protein
MIITKSRRWQEGRDRRLKNKSPASASPEFSLVWLSWKNYHVHPMHDMATIGTPRDKSRICLDIVILLALTLFLFWDVLFVSEPLILSRKDTDLRHLFIHLRAFTFEQLRLGNLALWNPYYFSGLPCLGSLQAAPLYPPNLIFLIPSLPHAINGSIAFHVFAMGVTMYLWSSHRRIRPLASLFSATLAMFGGTYFLHVTPGSLPNLCAMVWTPLVLLALDGWHDRPAPGWILLGILAVSMQILAGHPQYVFYTGVSALVYSGLHVIARPGGKRTLTGMPLIYTGAVLLAAIQLLPALQTAGESARAGGISYEFASSFSFPPENFITLLVPGFFGDMHDLFYWGRGLIWEMCPFFSITGLVLCIYGSIHGPGSLRRFSVTMSLLLMLLALGGRTPLLRILYQWVPGFDMFRGSSKFMFQASLFLVMLAGIGLDHLMRHGQDKGLTKGSVLLVGLALAAGALFVHLDMIMADSKHSIRPLMAAVSGTLETYSPPALSSDPLFIRQAVKGAGNHLAIASLTCLLLWLLLTAFSVRRKGLWCVAVLGIIEILVFAESNRPTFPMELVRNPSVTDFLRKRPGDYRVLDTRDPNMGMSMKVSNIWGYDTPSKRYAEFMAFTQGQRVDGANEYTRVTGYHNLYRMLRCRFHFLWEGKAVYAHEMEEIMPRLTLVPDYTLIRKRDDILAAMNAPDFDPRQRVILEEDPFPSPVRGDQKGTAEIVDSSTDHLTVRIDTPQPAVLLITDPFSAGWRASALEGSVPKEYRILRANYILMAVPLQAGRHGLRIEYIPSGFRIGKWISVLSLWFYLMACAWYFLKAYRSSKE